MSEPALSPRSPEVVSFRTLALGALVFRATVEKAEQATPGRHQNERAIVNLTWWLVSQKILQHQTEWERSCFRKALGELPGAHTDRAIWRVEGLAVLLWAHGSLEESPPFQSLADVEEILLKIPFFEEIGSFISRGQLRPAAAIARRRDSCYLWHLAAEKERLGREVGDEEALLALEGAYHALFGELAGGDDAEDDLIIDTDFLGSLTGEGLRAVSRLARERHHALSWALDEHLDWENSTLSA